MYILPVTSNKYQTKNIKFQSKDIQIQRFFNAEQITKQLSRMEKVSPETKKIFAGLTAAVSALMAEFAIYTEKNEQAKNLTNSFLNQMGFNDINEFRNGFSNFFDIQKREEKEADIQSAYLNSFKENSLRNQHHEFTKTNYPKLNQKYEQIILNYIKEPENTKNKTILDTIEIILDTLTENNAKYTKGYLDALENKYYDCIEEICENVNSTIMNDHSPMYYLIFINNETITKDEIQKWAKAKYLSCDEFMNMRNLDENILINLKQKNNKFRITKFIELPNYIPDNNNYAFKLEFDEDVSLSERLKTVTNVHTAIYGPIFAKEQKEPSDLFATRDIQTELLENIVKDQQLNSIFNIIMYLEPNALKKFDITGEDVKFLEENSQTRNKIKQICRNVLINLDLESEKMTQLASIMNNDEIFKNILNTRHSRLRFISRFVLKNNFSGDLEEKTREKVNILEKDLMQSTDKCNYFCYVHPKGFAPQFYLRSPSLGKFIKITLNDSGTISTLYEDYNKEIKERTNISELE